MVQSMTECNRKAWFFPQCAARRQGWFSLLACMDFRLGVVPGADRHSAAPLPLGHLLLAQALRTGADAAAWGQE
ncbi:hypothetical protein BJF93_02620 [Xaviernesmea oryzae]|uniref:Uncharacterized protein n=1 Tax=Xaviernesmea oryzae TaxID=464029 RepID=A0A1Q9AZ62_9HYPH|nr:hypothetical protein BJF93_02620 [Xaviernesmea oryzae]